MFVTLSAASFFTVPWHCFPAQPALNSGLVLSWAGGWTLTEERNPLKSPPTQIIPQMCYQRPLWLTSARMAEGNRQPSSGDCRGSVSWKRCDGHGSNSCSLLHRSALEGRMTFQWAQICPGYFWQVLLNITTPKLVFYRQWYFKSFSYRTVIKSHQIISVTLSRELIGESVMLRRENQSWIYQLGWEFEMYLGSYSE